jgi:hypothetical protein
MKPQMRIGALPVVLVIIVMTVTVMTIWAAVRIGDKAGKRLQFHNRCAPGERPKRFFEKSLKPVTNADNDIGRGQHPGMRRAQGITVRRFPATEQQVGKTDPFHRHGRKRMQRRDCRHYLWRNRQRRPCRDIAGGKDSEGKYQKSAEHGFADICYNMTD